MSVTFERRTLDNGLTIIAEVDPDAASAAAGFFVRTGARDEDGSIMGVSHFLEHMMFKGTDSLTAEDINRALDDAGARANAYTTTEMTCFYAHTLPERLGEIVDLYGQAMRPALRQDDFDTEKEVILEEIAMYKDNPFWVLYEAVCDAHFRDNPLGHRVLGTAETVGSMQRDQMMAYFQARYSADNTVLAAAGRLDFDELCGLAERRCGSWEPTNVDRDSARPEAGASDVELHDPRINRAYMLMLADAPAIEDDRRYAAAMLARVLGDVDNSRLHWSLVETGLAEEAQASFDPHDGTGTYFVYASGEPARTVEIWETIEREIAGLVASVSDHDLERLRNKFATAVTLGGERPHDRMQRLGRLWTYTHRYRTLEDELEAINRVTLDDLRAVWEAYPMRPRTVGRLLP